jgi:lauroyl/myristoyl acyltransferase
MPMNNLYSTRLCLGVAALLGKLLPYKTGHALARAIGSGLGKDRKNPMVKAIRANQWVVHDQELSPQTLEERPRTVFRNAARCLFDYFYYLPRPEALKKVVSFSPRAQEALERIKDNQATVVVCPHLSNFDLMGYALALNQMRVQVLSFPKPNASYKLQNRLREGIGIEVTPMSLSAFRQARRRLREGGSILTGLDRPLPDNLLDKYRPKFFGHETHLPVTYVRMAREAGAPVIIMAATSQPGGSYRLEGSAPIWMESAADLETEILTNANAVLKEAEGLIRKYARQWAMFYPIWPQFLGV